MDPTDNQDELMHDLICDSTAYVAPEFDEDENDGSQFLNLPYNYIQQRWVWKWMLKHSRNELDPQNPLDRIINRDLGISPVSTKNTRSSRNSSNL